MNAPTTFTTPDGRTIYIESNCYGVVEDGNLVRIWGTQTDVTQEYLAEQAMSHHRRLLSGAERIAGRLSRATCARSHWQMRA